MGIEQYLSGGLAGKVARRIRPPHHWLLLGNGQPYVQVISEPAMVHKIEQAVAAGQLAPVPLVNKQPWYEPGIGHYQRYQ